MSLADYLIRRAQRTPYFHLEGYMNRWWLVPYGSGRASPTGQFAQASSADHGCGFVSWWRRPIARLLQHYGIAIRVHEILRSDKGRSPHNHPWPYLSIILKGGYWEYTYSPEGKELNVEWRGVGSVKRYGHDHFHILHLPARGGSTWTLFITGKRADAERPWGFVVNGVFVPRDQHVEEV